MLTREVSLAQRNRLGDCILPDFASGRFVEGWEIDDEIEAGAEEGLDVGELLAGEENKAGMGGEVVGED